MANTVRNPSTNERTLIEAINAIRHIEAASSVHADAAELVVTAANATDLASAIALAQNLSDVYNTHRVDLLAHAAADSTNTVATAKSAIVSQSTAITFANQLKAAYNAHRSQSGVHHADDSGHATSSSDASGALSLYTLLNELKTDINAHMAASLAGASLRAIGF